MLDEKITKSRSVRQLDEIIFLSGASCVTRPDELNEMVQYFRCTFSDGSLLQRNIFCRFTFVYRESSFNFIPTRPFPEFSFSYVTNSFDCPVVSLMGIC